MKNIQRYLLVITVVALAGCAGKSDKQIAFDTWATACDGYATSLLVLAPSIADGTMSDEGVETVKQARDFIGPNCLNGVPIDPTQDITQQIQLILLNLQGLGVE